MTSRYHTTPDDTGVSHHSCATLFPLLEGEDLAALADDIRAHGLREPIWLYEGLILDGRNRERACKMVAVEPRYVQYTGDDPIGFSWSMNGARRHLNRGQLAGATTAMEGMYAELAAERKAKLFVGNTNAARKTVPADLPEPFEGEEERTEVRKGAREREAREMAAKVTGASGRTVGQYKRVAKQAPDLAEKVMAGDVALDRAERIIRDRDAEQRRVQQARREAEAQPEPLRVDIRHGDFREVLADLTDIDAIITDPPYPAEFLPLLDDLAAWADKVLTPEGVLMVLIGQTHLPEVYRRLDGHRPYRWTGCYLTEGPGYVSHPRRVQSSWKPLLVYGGGPRFSDVVRSEGSDANAKALHRWGQDYNAFHTLIERLTTRGQTVADPFMGSGTTLLAAHALGRHTVGADTDPDAVATSRERLT